MMFMKNWSYALILIVFIGILLSSAAMAQTRDYLTDDEIELVRDAQAIDQRIDVLTHAIDRRLSVLNLGGTVPTDRGKNSDKWGPLPTGTRSDLLSDINRILQKAIDDIDNLAERPDSATLPYEGDKKPKPTSELFPKAVRKLAAAAKRYGPALEAEQSLTKDAHEKGLIAASLEMCGDIIASVAKLPAEAVKQKGKDH